MSTKFLFSNVCWQRPAIWIFTEGEGDGIESRLLFKIYSTKNLHSFIHFCERNFTFLVWNFTSFQNIVRAWNHPGGQIVRSISGQPNKVSNFFLTHKYLTKNRVFNFNSCKILVRVYMVDELWVPWLDSWIYFGNCNAPSTVSICGLCQRTCKNFVIIY